MTIEIPVDRLLDVFAFLLIVQVVFLAIAAACASIVLAAFVHWIWRRYF